MTTTKNTTSSANAPLSANATISATATLSATAEDVAWFEETLAQIEAGEAADREAEKWAKKYGWRR